MLSPGRRCSFRSALRVASIALLAGVAVDASADTPEPSTTASGVVVDQRTRWTRDGGAIVTESLLRTDAGDQWISQLGGDKDGIGMVVLHGPALATVGSELTVQLHRGAAHSWVQRMWQGRTDLSRITEPPVMEFAHTRNVNGTGLHWASGCVFITYDSAGSSDISGDREFSILDESLLHWTNNIEGCSYLRFVKTINEPLEVGNDQVNLVKFREQRWCRPAMGGEDEICYDRDAAGLTTLFFDKNPQSSRNGEIFDADIELNGIYFSFSEDGVSDGLESCLADLANTFTHEVGHLIGLDHTCYAGRNPPRDSDPPWPLDQNGQLVPECSGNNPAVITEATMYNFQACGETKKATLEQDDIDGYCAIYPLGDDPGTCTPPSLDTGCCAISGAASDPTRHWPILLALALFWSRSRRRRQRAGRAHRGCSVTKRPWVS